MKLMPVRLCLKYLGFSIEIQILYAYYSSGININSCTDGM